MKSNTESKMLDSKTVASIRAANELLIDGYAVTLQEFVNEREILDFDKMVSVAHGLISSNPRFDFADIPSIAQSIAGKCQPWAGVVAEPPQKETQCKNDSADNYVDPFAIFGLMEP